MSFCQGLQSCLEPKLIEPRVLRLKLTPSKSSFSRSISPSSCSESHIEENNTTIVCDMKNEKTEDIGSWSFLQCLTNTTKESADENVKVYVHPLDHKRSSSMLSEKSLEMCTESLGSETGSQVSETSDDITMISSPTVLTQLQLGESLVTKRTNRSVSFPPPLTSISGSSGVQVRPHREGGRLVLQAVTVSSSPTYFHAERSDGRLRLCLIKNPSPNEDDQEEEEEFDEEVCCDDDDMEGKSGKVRDEIGIENLPRPSRCKESGCGAGNKLLWEPFLVAT